jgi:CheY-like chemotaxis protein
MLLDRSAVRMPHPHPNTHPSPPRRILVAAALPSLAPDLARHLRHVPGPRYDVAAVALGWTALARIHRDAPDCLVLQPDLPDMDAFEVCRRAGADAGIPVVVLLPPEQHAAAPDWALAGAAAAVPLPAAPEAVAALVATTVLDPSRARNRFLLSLYAGALNPAFPPPELRSAAPSPDGRLLAEASDDFVLRLRDAATGAVRRHLDTSPRWLTCLAWSPDSRHLAGGALDGAIVLWSLDADAGRSLLGHSAAVASLTWSPDGRVLTSTSASGALRLWEPRSGALLPPPPRAPDGPLPAIRAA